MEKLSKLLSIGIFFHLILLASVNASNTLILKSNHISTLNKIAVEMVTKCYADVQSIVIHGASDKSTIQSMQDADSINVILLSDSSMINGLSEPQSKTKLFLMTPNSKMQLQEMLLTFKNSLWWDIMTAFFIIDKSTRECKNARNILKTAWKMNLVNSFFLCVNSVEKSMIYTYNPYTNRAPQPWKRVPSATKRPDGWTMYSRSHHHGNICRGLNFDRTKHLDGSIVRVVTTLDPVHTWVAGKDYNNSIIAKMYEYDSNVVKALEYSWNATLVFNIAKPGFVLADKPQGFLINVQNGSSDVGIGLRSYKSLYNITPSYPLAYSSYHILVNNRGFYTPLEKMKNYYGIVTLISMCIILAITFIVIVLCEKRRRWAFAAFEILRLLVNASLHSRMDTLARKIFFAMIFLYFLIMQATFQGRISGFLTKDEYRTNVEKLEDLRDPMYSKIYVTRATASIITDPLLRKKFIYDEPWCGSQVIGEDSVACIADLLHILEPAFDHKLHISKNPISTIKYVYPIRQDWPLKERYNIFLMRLEQSGVSKKWLDNLIANILNKQKKITATSMIHARPVSLSMLQFAFILYGVGMTLATICFIFERRIQMHVFHLILNKWRHKRRKHRNMTEVRQ